jgi:hypothetical protein
MATRIGSLLIRLAVEHGILQEGLSRSERDVKKTIKTIEQQAQQVADFGKKVALAVGLPLLGLAKAGIDGAIAQRKAVAQVETALASMGNVAGRTAEQLVAAADAMELRSLYDGDVILSRVTTSLLTFGKIAGDQFDRAQQAALDMATVLGGDPQAAAIMLGKALDSPLKGLTALGKNGTIQKEWIDANKARIAAMIEEGRLAEVQAMILEQVERQYRGQAQAVADQDPYRTFKVILDQISETLGEALLPYLMRMRDAVLENREKILEAAQSAVEFAGSMVRMAQALVPLVAGFVAYRVALVAATAVQAIYSSSLVAVAARVGVLNTAQLLAARSARLLTAALVANPFTAAAVAVGVLTAAFLSLRDSQAAARAETDNLIRSLDAAIKARGSDVALKRAEADAERMRAQARLTQLESQLGRQKGVGAGYAAQALGPEITDLRWKVIELEASVRLADRTLKDMERTARDVAVPVAQSGVAAEGAGKKLRELGGGAKAAANDFQNLYNRLFPYEAAIRQLEADKVLIRSQKALTEARREEIVAALEQERLRSRVRSLGPATVSSWLNEEVRLVEAATDDIGKSYERLQAEMKSAKILKETGDFAASVKVLQQQAQVSTVAIADSFRDMADRTLQAFDRLTSAIKGGGFLDILSGLVGLGVQLGSTGLFGKGIAANINAARIPGRANGTAYHPGGLMMVGERGPEILAAPRGSRVVPNHELRAVESAPAVVNNYYTLPSDEFWSRVDGRAAGVAAPIAQATTARAFGRAQAAQEKMLA